MRYIKGRPKKEPTRPAIETALWYLGRRERTVKELSDKLLQRGYEAQEIDPAIEKLTLLGYLNDLNYAKNYMAHSLSGRAKGKRRVIFELSRKGVSAVNVETALAEVWVEDEDEIIIKEAHRILKRNANQSREKMFTRAIAYLVRRGFSFDASKKTVLRCLDEEDFL